MNRLVTGFFLAGIFAFNSSAFAGFADNVPDTAGDLGKHSMHQTAGGPIRDTNKPGWDGQHEGGQKPSFGFKHSHGYTGGHPDNPHQAPPPGQGPANNNVNLNTSTARARAAASSSATSASGSQSTSSVNITNASTRGSQTTRVVTPPTIAAASLSAAGIEACLGSVSGGGSFMGGGFSFGTTTKDDDCNRRLYARQLYNMGYPEAALAIQCLSPEVSYAMAVTGTPCPGAAPVLADRAAVVSAYAGTLPGPVDVTNAPAGMKWVPNPEYAVWQRENGDVAEVRR
jgi:hypothetical protein